MNTKFHSIRVKRPLSSSNSSSDNKQRNGVGSMKVNYSFTPSNKKNVSYSAKSINGSNRLDVKHQKTIDKIEKMRNEQESKIMSEMRKTPKINSHSRKIIEKISFHTNITSPNSQHSKDNLLNRSNNTYTSQQSNVSDYISMLNRRKCILKEISQKKIEVNTIAKQKSNKKRIVVSKNNKSNKNLPTDYRPIIKRDNNDMCYRKYNPNEVFNVRNRYHNYYNKMIYGKENDSCRTEVPNQNNNNLEVCNIEEIKEIQTASNKPENLFNRKIYTASVKQDKISKRENDLKKFLMFTEEISKNNSKSSSVIKPPQKRKEDPFSRMKVIDHNEEEVDNHQYNNEGYGEGFEIEENDMKLNEASKAFVEEKLRKLRQNMNQQ